MTCTLEPTWKNGGVGRVGGCGSPGSSNPSLVASTFVQPGPPVSIAFTQSTESGNAAGRVVVDLREEPHRVSRAGADVVAVVGRDAGGEMAVTCGRMTLLNAQLPFHHVNAGTGCCC